MNDDDRELVNRLFTVATARLEDAMEHAVAGQSPKVSSSRLFAHAIRLQARVQEVATIAEAAMIVSRSDSADGRTRRPKQMRRKRSTSP